MRRNPDDWKDLNLERYWAWNRARPGWLSHTFAGKMAPAIVNFVRATGRLKGKVLDVGCGPSHVTTELMRARVRCYAADVTQSFADDLSHQFQGQPNWGGAVTLADLTTSFQPHYFDVITCVEVLQHLPDHVISTLFGVLRGLVSQQGILVVVTPLAEELNQGMVYCPFCDSEFHRQQHFRCETEESLQVLLETTGFELEFCHRVDLARFHPAYLPADWGDWSFEILYDAHLWWRRRLRDKLFPQPFPKGRSFLHMAGPTGQYLCAVAHPRQEP